MLINLGTTSEDKRRIVDSVLKSALLNSYQLVPCNVSSGIADQPLDAEATIQGSKNRALNAMAITESPCDASIGLEGGLIEVEGLNHLFCSATMVDSQGNLYLGISTKRPLPTSVSKDVREGKQFGESIRKYLLDHRDSLTSEEISKIDELISRRQSFTEALTACISQYSLNTINT
jgi:non-canonical (house-cleaning) NTP pyrophosphatase